LTPILLRYAKYFRSYDVIMKNQTWKISVAACNI